MHHQQWMCFSTQPIQEKQQGGGGSSPSQALTCCAASGRLLHQKGMGERVLFSFQLKYLHECTKRLLLSLCNTTVRGVTEMKVCQVENFRV